MEAAATFRNEILWRSLADIMNMVNEEDSQLTIQE
jgi:hypothetical protein